MKGPFNSQVECFSEFCRDSSPTDRKNWARFDGESVDMMYRWDGYDCERTLWRARERNEIMLGSSNNNLRLGTREERSVRKTRMSSVLTNDL